MKPEIVPNKKLDLIRILSENQNLSFLVGAGCSIDSPSCLPSGKQMMRSLIEYFCINSKKEILYKLIKENMIRFEALIESIQIRIDRDMKIIEYYDQCNSPNTQHFFIAEQIKKGNIIMTTNFDHLIEKALLGLNIGENEIIPVITKSDYANFSNPKDLMNKGKYPVYKIHGAHQNYITKDDTKNSLITTIKAFGKNKEGMNLFQIEPFKRAFFDNATKDRILIVLGYSGSDDFDIIPTLKQLNQLDMIIWVNYNKLKNDYEIFQIEEKFKDSNSSKIVNLFQEIRSVNPNIKLFVVNANTTQLLKQQSNERILKSYSSFQLSPSDWFSLHLPIDNIIKKYHISINILLDFSVLEDALELSMEMLDETRKQGDKSWEHAALGNIAYIYRNKGDIPSAIDYFTKGLEIATELKETVDIAAYLQNIGESYLSIRKFDHAFQFLDEALVIFRDLNQRSKMIPVINHIANIYSDKGDQDEALILLKEAEKIAVEEGGDPITKMKLLATKGLIYERKRDYNNALIYEYEGLKIAELLNDEPSIAGALSNIAKIHFNKKDYLTSIELLVKAINLYGKLNLNLEKAKQLSNLAFLHRTLKNKTMALDYSLQAYKIYEDFGLEKTEAGVSLKKMIDSLKA